MGRQSVLAVPLDRRVWVLLDAVGHRVVPRRFDSQCLGHVNSDSATGRRLGPPQAALEAAELAAEQATEAAAEAAGRWWDLGRRSKGTDNVYLSLAKSLSHYPRLPRPLKKWFTWFCTVKSVVDLVILLI